MHIYGGNFGRKFSEFTQRGFFPILSQTLISSFSPGSRQRNYLNYPKEEMHMPNKKPRAAKKKVTKKKATKKK